MKIYLIFSILISFILSSKDAPGLKIAITQTGLKNFESVYLPQYINDKPLPMQPFKYEGHVDFLGNILLDTKDNKLTFHKLSDETVDLELKEPNKLNMILNGITADYDFNYDFQSGFYKNKGSATLKITEIKADVTAIVNSIKNAKNQNKIGPNIEILDLGITVFKFEIVFTESDGKLEKTVKFFIDHLQITVKKLIEKDLMKTVGIQLNQKLKQKFENLDLDVEIMKNTLAIDISLESEPMIAKDTNILELNFNGTIYGPLVTEKYINKPSNIPAVTDNTKSFYGLINEYVFNTLFFTLFKNDLLKFKILSEPIHLTTDNFKSNIPNLLVKYGSKKMDLNIKVTQQPLWTITPGKTNLDLYADTEFIVRLNDTYNETALITNEKITFAIDLSFKNGAIVCNIKTIEVTDLTIKDTKVEADPKLVQGGLNTIFTASKLLFNLAINDAIKKVTDKLPEYLKPFLKTGEFSQNDGFIQIAFNTFKLAEDLKFLGDI